MDVEPDEAIVGNDQTNGLAGNLEGDGKDSEPHEKNRNVLGEVIDNGLGLDEEHDVDDRTTEDRDSDR